jgi:hypothetical protein
LEVGLEAVLAFDGEHAPVVRGVAHLDGVIGDVQVHGAVRGAGDKQGIEARELEHRPEVAPAARIAPAVVLGRLADDLEALAEERRARQQPREEPEDVVRPEGIGAGGDAIEEEPRAEAVPAEELAVGGLWHLLHLDGAGGEVDVEDAAVEGEIARGEVRGGAGGGDNHRRLLGVWGVAAFEVAAIR